MDVDKGLSKPGALRRRLPWFFVNATLVIGLFAPLIANNMPVFAEVDGKDPLFLVEPCQKRASRYPLVPDQVV